MAVGRGAEEGAGAEREERGTREMVGEVGAGGGGEGIGRDAVQRRRWLTGNNSSSGKNKEEVRAGSEGQYEGRTGLEGGSFFVLSVPSSSPLLLDSFPRPSPPPSLLCHLVFFTFFLNLLSFPHTTSFPFLHSTRLTLPIHTPHFNHRATTTTITTTATATTTGTSSSSCEMRLGGS